MNIFDVQVLASIHGRICPHKRRLVRALYIVQVRHRSCCRLRLCHRLLSRVDCACLLRGCLSVLLIHTLAQQHFMSLCLRKLCNNVTILESLNNFVFTTHRLRTFELLGLQIVVDHIRIGLFGVLRLHVHKLTALLDLKLDKEEVAEMRSVMRNLPT